MNPTNNQPLARAVLWDMDGTLIDSMPYHWQAWQDVLAPDQSPPWSTACGIRPWACATARSSRCCSRTCHPTQAQYVDQAKEERYRELIELQGIELLPGVAEWIQRFQSGGLATGDRFVGPAPKMSRPLRTCSTSTAPSMRLISGARRAARQTRSRYLSRRRRTVERRAAELPRHRRRARRHRSRAPGRHESDRGVEYASAPGSGSRVQSLQDLTWEMIEDLMPNA